MIAAYNIITVIVLLGVLWTTVSFMIFLTGKLFLTKNLLEKRFKAAAETVRGGSIKPHKVAFKPTVAKYGNVSIIGRFVNLIRQNPFLKEEDLVLKFNQAGWASDRALWIYSIGKIFCVIAALDLSVFILERKDHSYTFRLSVATIVIVSGWFFVNMLLTNSIKKRLLLIDKGFTQSLDLIIVCVGSGINFTKALERVAKEMFIFSPDVAHELATTSKELTILLDRRQALTNLTNRVPTHAIKSFATVISQSFQQGTPILQALTLLAREERQHRLHRAEIRAAKLPSIVAIPLVALMLPSLLLVILGPPLSNLLAMFKN